MLTAAMMVTYLTITICTVDSPVVCENKYFKNNEATLHSCVMQGVISGQKIIEQKGKRWKIKKWRCSHRAPDLGV